MYNPSSEEEKIFLEKYDPNKYRKPCVTVDNIIYTTKGKDVKVLLVTRKNYPYKDYLALPGGFLDVGMENTEQAVMRELKEETSLTINRPELFGVYSDPDRDPRDHVVSIVYSCEVNTTDGVQANDDAADAKFYDLKEIILSKNLAFDHRKILQNFCSHYYTKYNLNLKHKKKFYILQKIKNLLHLYDETKDTDYEKFYNKVKNEFK